MTKLRGPFAQWLSNRLSVSQCNANVQYYHWIADSRHRPAIPVFDFHAGYYNAVHNEEDIVLDEGLTFGPDDSPRELRGPGGRPQLGHGQQRGQPGHHPREGRHGQPLSHHHRHRHLPRVPHHGELH